MAEDMDTYSPADEMARFETENRIRNLVWTVSGDYSLKTDPDAELYARSRYRGLYRAVCEGAFFRCYDRAEFSLYLLKKMYYEADEAALGQIVRLCMDASVWRWISEDRRGIRNLRKRAAEDFLEQEFAARSASRLGALELQWYAGAAGSGAHPDPQTEDLLFWLEELGKEPRADHGNSPEHVIAMVDRIYNTLADPAFEKKHGGLEQVLAVTLDELAEADFDWKEFLKEEAEAEEELPDSSAEVQTPDSGGEKTSRAVKVIRVDEESRKKAYAYMELNYGRSYMNPAEARRLSLTLCRGVHENCSLFFTDGILGNMVKKNYQSEYVRRQYHFNVTELKRCRTVANRNIQRLAHMMEQAMIRRNEIDQVRSNCGNIRPRDLWKAGRTGDPKLFSRTIRQENSSFAVDILMDASGSQHDRRGSVAVQGYIISEALSRAGIPHRVQSFCTCWDYTILQRFREYDDPMEADLRILEYSTSANNRDGLAIRAVVHTLLQRPEENRILIVLSDGRPNDRVVSRAVGGTPSLYVGDEAVHDTAEEVRRARRHGIAVLGVFSGKEQDLEAEKRIFGRDFAYVRDIRNLSHVVGRYLRRQIDLT